MDEQMKDNDIIKAMECCKYGDCQSCPGIDVDCVSEIFDGAVDIINRQKAEIERLQKYNTDVAFKHYNDGIKEFAERLKEEFANNFGSPVTDTPRIIIDNLVKEMTGEINGK